MKNEEKERRAVMIRTVGWFGQNVFFITYGTYSPAKSCEVAK